MRPFAKFDPNTHFRNLFDRHVMVNESRYMSQKECVMNRTCAFLCPAVYVEPFKVQTFRGAEALFMIPDTPFRYHLAPVIRKTSPYATRINEILNRVTAGGFIQHQVDKALTDSKMDSIKEGQVAVSELRIIRLEHFTYVFYYYAAATTVASILFICECLLYRLNFRWKFAVEKILCT